MRRLQRIATIVKENPSGVSWLHVGHGYGDVDRKQKPHYYIWVFADRKIEVKGPFRESYIDNTNLAHSNLWSEGGYEDTYRGRYDANQKIISVTKPYAFRFREVPESLVDLLEKKFPEAEHIYVYG